MSGKEVIKKLKLENIRFKKLKKFPVKFLFPNTSKGRELDLKLQSAYLKIKQNGKLESILKRVLKAYEEVN